MDCAISPTNEEGFLKHDGNSIRHDIVGPLSYLNDRRLSYENDDYQNLCRDKVNEYYFAMIAESHEYDEFQMIGIEKDTREPLLTGVAYTKTLKLGSNMNGVVPFDLDLDEDVSKANQKKAKEQVLALLQTFETGLFIEVLCTPFENNGATQEFINWLKYFHGRVYNVVLIKAHHTDIQEYEALGFKPVFTFQTFKTTLVSKLKKRIDVSQDAEGLTLLYLPLKVNPVIIQLGMHCRK